jgi:hypothetical protein
VLLAGALVVNATAAGPSKVRYSVKAPMVASDVDTNATGRVEAFLKQQGNSDHQRLRITAAHLDPRTSYQLLALIGSNVDYVTVTNFSTSARGRAVLMYFQNRALRSNGHNGGGSGVNRHALPTVLDPLTDVRALAIADTNSEIVLSVNLHASESMSFELASIFDNTGSDPMAIGCMAVACQGPFVQFRLLAVGQSSQYTFCVNEAPVATYHADGTGMVNVGTFPNGAPAPMYFKKMCMRNAGDQVVLQSEVSEPTSD